MLFHTASLALLWPAWPAMIVYVEPMRRFVPIFAVGLVAITVLGDSVSPVAEALPGGFQDSLVGSVSSPTAVEQLPTGAVVVLEQATGRVRLIDPSSGQIAPTPALDLTVCAGSERGLLGFTHDPDFGSNRRVYVFYTRNANGFPGGCVNRVSAFQMNGSTIDPASEQVLIDNISSVGGNHNGGDLEVGNDGYLYVATGDAGGDPRGNSGSGGSNDAAKDLSLLNGKILRLDRFSGAPAPGNPIGGSGAVSCGSRGNLPSTPGTVCREIFSWGLRNPYRFAFDPNTSATRRRYSWSRLWVERPRGSVSARTDHTLCWSAGGGHRSDCLVPKIAWHLYHRWRLHSRRSLGRRVRRRLPVCRWWQRQDLAAPGRRKRRLQ